MVLVQSKYGNRFCYWMDYGIFSKEEGSEIDHEMLHQIRGGMSNGLGYLGRTVARKQSRLTKAQPAVKPPQMPAHGDTVRVHLVKPEETKEAFRRAALDGGLTRPDVDAVDGVRGKVSYEALTEFAKDQIKEGRKGKDLKDDLLTFIKLVNSKK